MPTPAFGEKSPRWRWSYLLALGTVFALIGNIDFFTVGWPIWPIFIVALIFGLLSAARDYAIRGKRYSQGIGRQFSY